MFKKVNEQVTISTNLRFWKKISCSELLKTLTKRLLESDLRFGSTAIKLLNSSLITPIRELNATL